MNEQSKKMQAYYAWQSKIYDATRWSFLFGRDEIIKRLPFQREDSFKVLEIGCGTGYNLSHLAQRFPNAELIGLDVSDHMIDKSYKKTRAFSDRLKLENRPYTLGETNYNDQIDLILFSYSLTMINPQWRDLILRAGKDLKKGGHIAVVDFYDSKFQWFKNHMSNHHVRMDSHLTPLLDAKFKTSLCVVKTAYGGIWQYFMYLGTKQ
jgi:S-adenosylmethionine-diacylgycerolhomoserine-N-methlytransferase